MKGGKGSREKGNRTERAIVRALQDHGLGAERVPLSGSAGGSYLGDLTAPLLVVKADRREPLVIIPLRLAVEIARVAEGKKGGTQ
jgi:hypothetical protein